MRAINELIQIIKNTVDSHKLENEGEYARYLWQDEQGTRKLGLNEYGCADAMNILYTINEFPRDINVRNSCIKTLQAMQNPETGLFEEGTHHFIHTTAHCIAALELFDALPLYPLKELDRYITAEGLVNLLEGLDWENKSWSESHKGAGIYAAMKLTDSVDAQWEKAYFDWMWENADPEFGFWKKGTINKDSENLYHFMGGGFHYLFNHEYAKMPLRYPEKIIDFCLELYAEGRIGNDFGKKVQFIEMDWVYSITRALRQCGHRREDCMNALRKFAKEHLDWLCSIDYQTHDQFNDLHMLFGTTCTLAELQSALPGEIITRKPLRLVLDRRPFI